MKCRTMVKFLIKITRMQQDRHGAFKEQNHEQPLNGKNHSESGYSL